MWQIGLICMCSQIRSMITRAINSNLPLLEELLNELSESPVRLEQLHIDQPWSSDEDGGLHFLFRLARPCRQHTATIGVMPTPSKHLPSRWLADWCDPECWLAAGYYFAVWVIFWNDRTSITNWDNYRLGNKYIFVRVLDTLAKWRTQL
jgi:hypothetical protein